jgi:hypothetical protein
MIHVAGVDGAPDGWAVVIMEADRSVIRKVAALSNIFDGATDFDIIAVGCPHWLAGRLRGRRSCL